MTEKEEMMCWTGASVLLNHETRLRGITYAGGALGNVRRGGVSAGGGWGWKTGLEGQRRRGEVWACR